MIVTTYIDGLVRLYRFEDDALVQVGQLTAPQPVDPVLLATMAGDLALALHWDPSTNGTAPTPVQPLTVALPVTNGTTKAKPKPGVRRTPPKTKAKAKGKHTRDYRSNPRATREESAARLDLIRTTIVSNGPQSVPALGAVVFPGDDAAESRVRKIIDRMVRDDMLLRLDPPAPGKAATFTLTPDRNVG